MPATAVKKRPAPPPGPPPELVSFLPSLTAKPLAGFEALARRFEARGYAVSLVPLDGGLATALVAMKQEEGQKP